MTLRDLENKKIALLGLGLENYALVKFLLEKKTKCRLTVCDARNKERLGEKFTELKNKASWKLGQNFNRGLYDFDILFRSPGWPLSCPGITEAVRKRKIISRPAINFLSSPMNLFFELCPTKNIIGVTGTKGKGTTSSLIAAILRADGKKVWLGGNIGVAPFAFLKKLKPADWVVLELSSFQLEDLRSIPKIAVITNFSPEHLKPTDPNNPNYHKNLKEYWKAKVNIFSRRKEKRHLIANKKLKPRIASLKNGLKNLKIIYFDKSELASSLPGEHNKENVAAAVLATKLAGAKDDKIALAVKKFRGLEHRIEFAGAITVPPHKGDKGGSIRCYDDSFATIPESAVIALKSFTAPIILLAGGADKGADFKLLAEEIKKRVKYLVLFHGDATPRLRRDVIAAGYDRKKISLAASMKEAANIARANALPGDVILMSPACASFGMFKNYKERGDMFKKIIPR